jgi:hypothetical protein
LDERRDRKYHADQLAPDEWRATTLAGLAGSRHCHDQYPGGLRRRQHPSHYRPIEPTNGGNGPKHRAIHRTLADTRSGGTDSGGTTHHYHRDESTAHPADHDHLPGPRRWPRLWDEYLVANR